MKKTLLIGLASTAILLGACSPAEETVKAETIRPAKLVKIESFSTRCGESPA